MAKQGASGTLGSVGASKRFLWGFDEGEVCRNCRIGIQARTNKTPLEIIINGPANDKFFDMLFNSCLFGRADLCGLVMPSSHLKGATWGSVPYLLLTTKL